MPNVAFGNKVHIRFRGTYHGQRVLSDFCYKIESITTPPVTMAAMTTSLHTQVTNAGRLQDDFLNCCTPEYTLDQIWYQWTISNIVYATIKQVMIGAIGTHPGTSDASNLCAVITRRGERATREEVSALHIPIGTDNVSLQAGFTAPLLATALGNLAIEMVAPITAAAGAGTVLKPVIDHDRKVDTSRTDITEATPQTTIRVMRRRTVGVGE